METFSALLAISAGSSPVSGEFPAHSGAGDLRRYRAHYDVIVMVLAHCAMHWLIDPWESHKSNSNSYQNFSCVFLIMKHYELLWVALT